MKYLSNLVFIIFLSILAACSKDEPTKVPTTAADYSGIYNGSIIITVGIGSEGAITHTANVSILVLPGKSDKQLKINFLSWNATADLNGEAFKIPVTRYDEFDENFEYKFSGEGEFKNNQMKIMFLDEYSSGKTQYKGILTKQ